MNGHTIVHLSDLHFGQHVDLAQISAVERLVPDLAPDAIAISGDMTQRARHGEFQRTLALVERLQATAPTLVVPGNHDVQWWRSPFGLFGSRPKYAKYRHYFGEDLTPVLRIPGLVLAAAITAHGLSAGSLTWNQRDLTVKGHLPGSEIRRLTQLLAAEDPGAAKVVLLHHNVLRGEISRRMGLSRWAQAQRRLLTVGADAVLCGHDHQEGAGQVADRLAISTAGTLTSRTRGKRPAVFNVVRIDASAVRVEYWRWVADRREFRPSDNFAFARSSGRPATVGAARDA